MSSNSPISSPRVAVVTVSYGSADVLPAFFESLAAASSSPIETIVVDNKAGGPEDVGELAARFEVRHVALPTNVGYGGAVNAGVASVSESVEWVLVSNPDLVMSAGAIDRLVKTGKEDADIGAVGPATLTADGELYPSARAVPSLRTGIGHALFANLWHTNPWTRAYRDDTVNTTGRSDAGWLSGSCLLVRRSAWDAVGGFDPEFFMYFEDVDLGYRLGKHGYRNVYEPAAVVTHTGAHSTTSDSGAMIQAHHDSARRFLEKKYSGRLLWPVRVALRTGLRIRSSLIKRRMARG